MRDRIKLEKLGLDLVNFLLLEIANFDSGRIERCEIDNDRTQSVGKGLKRDY